MKLSVSVARELSYRNQPGRDVGTPSGLGTGVPHSGPPEIMPVTESLRASAPSTPVPHPIFGRAINVQSVTSGVGASRDRELLTARGAARGLVPRTDDGPGRHLARFRAGGFRRYGLALW